MNSENTTNHDTKDDTEDQGRSTGIHAVDTDSHGRGSRIDAGRPKVSQVAESIVVTRYDDASNGRGAPPAIRFVNV